MSDIEQAKKYFFAALDFIDASDFHNAELPLREALLLLPGSVSVLTNLAVALQRQNKRTEARAFAEQAVAASADNIEAMLVLADCYAQDDDKTDEALAILTKIISLDATIADAHNNIGLVLRKLGRFAEALESLDRAIALEPGLAAAHGNRGSVLRNLVRYDEALAAYERALALKSDFAEAWLGRGNVLAALRRHDEARGAYRRALACEPDHVEALQALGNLLLSEGNIAEALPLARRAVAARETAGTKSLVAACLSSPLMSPALGDVRDLLLRALIEPWTRQTELALACASFVMLNTAIADGTARAAKAWPRLPPIEEMGGLSGLARIAEDRLFLAMLECAPVCTPALERFATALRGTALAAALSQSQGLPEQVLSLYCALARQCFVNNYVFAQSATESEQARVLRDSVAAALASGAEISPLSLAAIAAYTPLHTLPRADALLHRTWPAPIDALLAQQVVAPSEEQRLRQSMPVLTPIGDGVSAQVREQYEENPYPQWVKPAPAGKPKTIDVFFREKFPHSAFVALGSRADAAILVAGSGTGQHPIGTASRFKAAPVLAIDLSLTSLAYAKRQTRALDLDIEFAQADIMNLGSIGRTFDIIESAGVLHHLADPFAGWRVLLSLLRPRGIMLLGLYSEAARRHVVAARDFIAAHGYRATADDIRKFRQQVFDHAAGTPLRDLALNTEFFTLSDCRDLLFHVQEHRHTLPQIAAFLAENELQFLGFELDPPISWDYGRCFPDDVAMTDLERWHRYETDHPETFCRMYQFWVQKN